MEKQTRLPGGGRGLPGQRGKERRSRQKAQHAQRPRETELQGGRSSLKGRERCKVRLRGLQEPFTTESGIGLSSFGWVPGTLGGVCGFLNREAQEQICVLDPLAASKRDKTGDREPREETTYPLLNPRPRPGCPPSSLALTLQQLPNWCPGKCHLSISSLYAATHREESL